MKQTKIPLSVKQLIELDGCARCELCREFCSLYALLNENPHPLKFPTSTVAVIKQFRSILRDQFGLKAKLLRSKPKIKEKLWMLADALFLYCTTCGRCKVVCPLGIDTWSLLNSVREYFMNNFTSQYPTHCVIDFISNTINTTIQNSGNIFNVSNASRHDWALYTGADIQVKDNAKVVYFVGCVSSYQGRAQDIAHAITAILNSVGEDWTLLKDEWCCGHPLTISGAGNKAKSIAEHNLRMIRDVGAKMVITGCPGCYLALKHEYPKILGKPVEFEVLHFTELLNIYLNEGKLKPIKLDGKVTYHDPCELGRLGGVLNEPRRIINTFTNGLLEPYGSGMDGICCGSGGLIKATNPSLADLLAIKRLDMLMETKSKLILSACPTCVQSLSKVAMDKNKELRVIDLAELVAQQLGLI